MAIETPMLR